MTEAQIEKLLELDRAPNGYSPGSFVEHSWATQLGDHELAVAALPDTVASLIDAVRGLFVHGDYLPLYGLEPATYDRSTLHPADRLDRLAAQHALDIEKGLPIAHRAVVTCRDYALMSCAFFRQKNIAARVRCGFASYLNPGQFEDHWICEYWHGTEARWAQADAQLDEPHQAHLKLTFDTTNMPQGAFISAAEAWRQIRVEHRDPHLFGHGDTRGEWFVWLNLARDCYASQDQVTDRDLDNWRSHPVKPVKLNQQDQTACDELYVRSIVLAETRFKSGHLLPPIAIQPIKPTSPFNLESFKTPIG